MSRVGDVDVAASSIDRDALGCRKRSSLAKGRHHAVRGTREGWRDFLDRTGTAIRNEHVARGIRGVTLRRVKSRTDLRYPYRAQPLPIYFQVRVRSGH